MPYKKENKICPECSKDFIAPTNKKFCSVSCGTKFTSRERRKGQFNDKGQLLCTACKTFKNEDEYSRSKICIYRNGREFYCKECAYRAKRLRLFEKGENLELYSKGIINKIKTRSKEYKSEMDISQQNIIDLYNEQGGRCAISGEIMTLFLGGRGKISSNMSIDRIDSSKRYTLDNVHLVTSQINLMKNDTNLKEFLSICKIITQYNEPAQVFDGLSN